jgi:hypothetical protein
MILLWFGCFIELGRERESTRKIARRRARRRASRRAMAAERGQECYNSLICVLARNKLITINPTRA